MFLAEHPEFGSATTTQSVPDWVQGKRQRVRFANGRNLLFYLKDGKVVTVYGCADTEGRKKIWGRAYTAEYARDVDRQSEGELPDYTVIKAINLLPAARMLIFWFLAFQRILRVQRTRKLLLRSSRKKD